MQFHYRGEIKELNEKQRKAAEGKFIQLTQGVTHFELGGPPDGDPIVLVHGFSVPFYIFTPTYEFLTKSGYRTLRYDLFGRGWSDRPLVKYNLGLHVNQLIDLLDSLNLENVDMLGLSMGAPIAASLMDLHPRRVRSLILIDPVGIRPINLSRLLWAVKLPVIGEFVLDIFGNENMLKSIASDFFDRRLVDEFKSKYLTQMQYMGFKHAILSSLRSGMLGTFIDIYKRIGRLKKPTLIIWGRNDKTVPLAHSTALCDAIPHAQLCVIEDCNHLPHYEKPEIVNPILLQFLKSPVDNQMAGEFTA